MSPKPINRSSHLKSLSDLSQPMNYMESPLSTRSDAVEKSVQGVRIKDASTTSTGRHELHHEQNKEVFIKRIATALGFPELGEQSNSVLYKRGFSQGNTQAGVKSQPCEKLSQVLPSYVSIYDSTDGSNSVKHVDYNEAYKKILSYHPDSVKFKINGSVLVKPSDNYLQSANEMWKSSCIGYSTEMENLDFNVVRKVTLEQFKCVGLINVFKHPMGYMIFRFSSVQSMLTAIESSPMLVDCTTPHFTVHFKPWVEHFHNDQSNECVKVWIQLSDIPFSYWSIDGICQLASSIGKPVSLDNDTLVAAHNNEPKNYATVCVELGVFCSRPTCIVAVLPGHSDKFLARIKVEYLSTFEACLMCHSLDHVTDVCPELPEIIGIDNGKRPITLSAGKYFSQARMSDAQMQGKTNVILQDIRPKREPVDSKDDRMSTKRKVVFSEDPSQDEPEDEDDEQEKTIVLALPAAPLHKNKMARKNSM